MKRVLNTGPTVEPISVAEVKEHCRISYDFEDDDNYIDSLITVVRQSTEEFLHRALITQTWQVYMDAWTKTNYIRLPFGSLQSVTHVKYTDTDSTTTTWDTDEYNTDTYSDIGRVVLEYGYTFPTTTLHPQNPIEIQFVCGYGDNSDDVPTPILHAILIKVAEHYENREDSVFGQTQVKMNTVKSLLYRYILWGKTDV